MSERADKPAGASRNAPGQDLAARAGAVIEGETARPLEAGLYLVSTPIGNLADITLRALGVLARADLIVCEDTRHSRKLLSHYGIAGKLEAYHEHNAQRMRPVILDRIRAGTAVALISDAGTPLISDPGFKLVREALEDGLDVVSVPGPSAPIAALTSSGLPSDRFFFEGFLPNKRAGRRKRLEAIAELPGTVILFEAGPRLAEALRDAADVLGPRQGAVAKELTKRHETVLRGALPELADAFGQAGSEITRGEFVVLIEQGEGAEVSDQLISEHLEAALATMSLRDAAREVADELGVKRNRVYRLGLALADDQKA
jgi:16S rRNA (cytidine1402-2'-O)-methyltransferase